MDLLATYNYFFQIAAAFLIFIVGYLALLFLIVVCFLAVEGVHQSVIFARAWRLKRRVEHFKRLQKTPLIRGIV
ncbi:MAG: hypothetical protein ABSB66_01855 [Candidatus Acidiferrales bacterium]|jgi:hypothetical protein